MKKIIITLATMFILLSLLLAACQVPASPPADQVVGASELKVLVVESFLADIAQNVAGDRLVVDTLLPLGLDPHAYEPTPQDVVRIAKSHVLIINGAGFEGWLEETIANAGGERIVIEASAGLTSREAREGEAAVLSVDELASTVCEGRQDQALEEEITAGVDASGAVSAGSEEGQADEHEAEWLALRLHTVGDGTFNGFVKIEVDEDGEYVIAAGEGAITVLNDDGVEMEVEDRLALNCSGLKNGLVLDLEPGAYVIELSGMKAETTALFIGPAGSDHHHDGDPHFWLDPLSVVKYVENIRDGLMRVDPGGKEIYTQNAAAYMAQLVELDGWIQQQVSVIPEERRLIVTNHESFGYFADRYGFKIIGTIIPSVSSSASPSAQQMARLVDHIRDTGATAIFLETGASPQLAKQIASETGVELVDELFTHSITKAGGKAPTYIDMMKYNVDAIVEALGK
jgi:manganese/iron transport system substrate-binding protein